MSPTRIVSVERFVPAPPSAIFDLLSNPYRHHEIDGSGTVVHPRPGTVERLFLGAKFSMDMKMGASYFTNNKVVVFDQDRAIAWHHWAQFVWRYDLEPQDGGTLVRESFDYSKPWGLLIAPFGIPDKNRVSMEATLARLVEIFAGS